MSTIAACIIGFNRPKYLEQVIKSLEQNVEIDNVDWYAFIDGVYNQKTETYAGKQKLVDKSIQLLNKSELDFTISASEWNLGIALQKHRAHTLYESYETILFFENDLIVGKHYIRLLKIALKNYPEHLVLMNRFPGPKNRNRRYLNECRIARLWGYGLKEQRYRKFEKRWKEYISYIGEMDYRKRNSADKEVRDKFPYGSFSHDVVLTNLLRESGAMKLWPEVSRGKYIGKKGNYAYKLPHFWRKRKMHRQPDVITFERDNRLERFILR